MNTWILKNPRCGMLTAKITEFKEGFFKLEVFFKGELISNGDVRCYIGTIGNVMEIFKRTYSQYFRYKPKPEWELQKETTCQKYTENGI